MTGRNVCHGIIYVFDTISDIDMEKDGVKDARNCTEGSKCGERTGYRVTACSGKLEDSWRAADNREIGKRLMLS